MNALREKKVGIKASALLTIFLMAFYGVVSPVAQAQVNPNESLILAESSQQPVQPAGNVSTDSAKVASVPSGAIDSNQTLSAASKEPIAKDPLTTTGAIEFTIDKLSGAGLNENYYIDLRNKTRGGEGALSFSWLSDPQIGLTLSKEGVIQGRANRKGIFDIMFKVVDSNGGILFKELRIKVTDPIVLANTIATTNGIVGREMNYQIAASGGQGGLTFFARPEEVEEMRQAGFSLSEEGIISGTPNAVGNHSFEVRIRDDNWQLKILNLNLYVAPEPPFTISAPTTVATQVDELSNIDLQIPGWESDYITWDYRYVTDNPSADLLFKHLNFLRFSNGQGIRSSTAQIVSITDFVGTIKIEVTATLGNRRASKVITIESKKRPGDDVAPRIESLSEGEITHQGASIHWEANENTIGWLEYGLTENFGSRTVWSRPDARITGLASNTKYFYRVNMVDRSGNRTVSATKFFTTTTLTGGGNTVPFEQPVPATQISLNPDKVTMLSTDGDINISVLQNDLGPYDPSKVRVISSNSANGVTTALANGVINFKPRAGFLGVQTISYQVCTSRGEQCTTSQAEVTVVAAAPQTPKIIIDSNRSLFGGEPGRNGYMLGIAVELGNIDPAHVDVVFFPRGDIRDSTRWRQENGDRGWHGAFGRDQWDETRRGMIFRSGGKTYIYAHYLDPNLEYDVVISAANGASPAANLLYTNLNLQVKLGGRENPRLVAVVEQPPLRTNIVNNKPFMNSDGSVSVFIEQRGYESQPRVRVWATGQAQPYFASAQSRADGLVEVRLPNEIVEQLKNGRQLELNFGFPSLTSSLVLNSSPDIDSWPYYDMIPVKASIQLANPLLGVAVSPIRLNSNFQGIFRAMVAGPISPNDKIQATLKIYEPAVSSYVQPRLLGVLFATRTGAGEMLFTIQPNLGGLDLSGRQLQYELSVDNLTRGNFFKSPLSNTYFPYIAGPTGSLALVRSTPNMFLQGTLRNMGPFRLTLKIYDASGNLVRSNPVELTSFVYNPATGAFKLPVNMVLLAGMRFELSFATQSGYVFNNPITVIVPPSQVIS